MASQPTIGFLFHDIARLFRKRFEQRSRQFGLTRSQWQVLAYLSLNEGINQTTLADLLDVEPITAGRILDKMEERGLIERRRHLSDRRIWLLYLTPKSRPLLEQMHSTARLTREEALDGLPEEERQRLFDTLTLIKTNLLKGCASGTDEQEAGLG